MSAKVNGVPYDFGSLEVGVKGGVILAGLQSISYGHSVESAKTSGAGREDIDETQGHHTVDDAEVTVLESDYRTWIKSLGNGYMFKRFPLSVSYSYDGQPLIVDELKQCRFIKVAASAQKGPEGLTRALTLRVMRLKENGLDPVNAK